LGTGSEGLTHPLPRTPSVRSRSFRSTREDDDEPQDDADRSYVNPLLAIERAGKPISPPVWHDTILVREGQPVTFLTRYDRFTGKFVMHWPQSCNTGIAA
jgi:hypothetical protein